MNLGIGEGKTREDHRAVANQMYAAYAQGRDLRKLVAIVGEEALSDVDRSYLHFADQFEERIVGQGDEDRTIERDARHRLGAAGRSADERTQARPRLHREVPPGLRVNAEPVVPIEEAVKVVAVEEPPAEEPVVEAAEI